VFFLVSGVAARPAGYFGLAAQQWLTSDSPRGNPAVADLGFRTLNDRQLPLAV
jgi:hypothetical protein